jgi:hypothetical protein
MKGIIFTEFVKYVEETHGEKILASTMKKAGGVTADGVYIETQTYPYEEMFQLAGNLAAQTGVTLAQTFEDFGEYLFGNLARMFSSFFAPDETLFSFLQKLEDHIHVEVRKKYPDANLPGFEFQPIDAKNLRMIYTSERAMSDFGIGLIKGAAHWFNRDVFVGKKDLTPNHNGTRVEILVRLLDDN